MADTQYSLRGRLSDARFTAACQAVLGAVPPAAPNTVASGILWLGPDEWLVVGREHAEMARLKAALQGVHAALVDVSSNRVVIELEGADVEDLLSAAATLDFGLSAFPVGACAQTNIARTQGLIHRTAQTRFRIFVRPSFAGYLRSWFADARS